MSGLRLSLSVITLNEEGKLVDCLRSAPFADEIVVVDSGSIDRTREIAKESGAKVFVRPFSNFADQKNFSIEQTSGDWVLLLDADERLSPDLQSEIRALLALPDPLDGYYLRRHNYLFGGRMRFGANASDRQLRLIRRGKGRFEGIVHERIFLNGRAGHLKSPLLHFSYQTLGEYSAKFRLFCSLDAERMWREGKRPTVYHLWVKPLLHFVYFYIFKLGILDGCRGLLYQVLSTRYLYSKYWRARRLCRQKGRS